MPSMPIEERCAERAKLADAVPRAVSVVDFKHIRRLSRGSFVALELRSFTYSDKLLRVWAAVREGLRHAAEGGL